MNDAKTAQLGRHVAVRLARLPDWEAHLAGSEAILGEEDTTRANRFRFPEDKARFTLGRRLLASALAEFAIPHVLPLHLHRSPEGRPVLAGDAGIQFSISHSGDYISLALTIKSLVGVDLELTSRALDLKSLCERIFSKSDLATLKGFPDPDHPALFFRAWTAKEAYLKAVGLGLPGGLKQVSVPVDLADTPSPRRFQPRPLSPSWLLQRLPLPGDYAGCVVWDDPAKSVDFRVVKPTD